MKVIIELTCWSKLAREIKIAMGSARGLTRLAGKLVPIFNNTRFPIMDNEGGVVFVTVGRLEFWLT